MGNQLRIANEGQKITSDLRKFWLYLSHGKPIDNEWDIVGWIVLIAGFDVAHETHEETFCKGKLLPL